MNFFCGKIEDLFAQLKSFYYFCTIISKNSINWVRKVRFLCPTKFVMEYVLDTRISI